MCGEKRSRNGQLPAGVDWLVETWGSKLIISQMFPNWGMILNLSAGFQDVKTVTYSILALLGQDLGRDWFFERRLDVSEAIFLKCGL